MFFFSTIIILTSRRFMLESTDRLTRWLVDLYCHSHCPSDSSLERSFPFSLSETHTLNLKDKKLIGKWARNHRKCVRVRHGGKRQNIWRKSIFYTHTNHLTLQSVDDKIVLTFEHNEGGRSDVRHPSMTRSPMRSNQRRIETGSAHESRQDVAR